MDLTASLRPCTHIRLHWSLIREKQKCVLTAFYYRKVELAYFEAALFSRHRNSFLKKRVSVFLMSAVAAVQRLKEGSDAILKAALEQRDRPSHTHFPQSVQERLAAEAMAAAREVDDILEHAKLACAAESDEEVQREVCRR